jgi:hypothetical protein
MIRSYLIPILAAIPCAVLAAPKEVKPDLLRFTNGDQLHGSYQGVKEGGVVVWKRDDIDEPVELKPEKLRQVILRGGRPIESHASLGHVALINGDRIPGNVTGFDETTISIDTSFAGTLRIPRNQVGMIAPSPLGGRVNYHGPFVEDEWLMTNSNFPDGIPAPKKDEGDVELVEPPDEEMPDELAEGEMRRMVPSLRGFGIFPVRRGIGVIERRGPRWSGGRGCRIGRSCVVNWHGGTVCRWAWRFMRISCALRKRRMRMATSAGLARVRRRRILGCSETVMCCISIRIM